LSSHLSLLSRALPSFPTRRSSDLPFGTACCAIEFMSVVSSHYDIARFGSEVVRFSPKQSDVLMVLGTINDKMGPVLKQIYDQMADRKSTRLNSSHVAISYAVFCLK